MQITNGKCTFFDLVDSEHISFYDLYYKKSDLDNIFSNTNESELTKAKEKIKQLQAELAQAKEQLAKQSTNNQIIPANKGQGDSLLTLGAVMECLPIVAKNNYTQDLLIDTILESYPHTKNLSKSTLKKKFAESKKHLNQNFN